MTRSFRVCGGSNMTLVDVTADLLLEFLKINGQKSLDVTPVARACGSWRSATEFHTKLCGRFSRKKVEDFLQGFRTNGICKLVGLFSGRSNARPSTFLLPLKSMSL